MNIFENLDENVVSSVSNPKPLKLRTATKEVISFSATFPLNIKIGKLQVRIWFGTVQKRL